jgi:hypothetical protein
MTGLPAGVAHSIVAGNLPGASTELRVGLRTEIVCFDTFHLLPIGQKIGFDCIPRYPMKNSFEQRRPV